jgi:hypothetical protein
MDAASKMIEIDERLEEKKQRLIAIKAPLHEALFQCLRTAPRQGSSLAEEEDAESAGNRVKESFSTHLSESLVSQPFFGVM